LSSVFETYDKMCEICTTIVLGDFNCDISKINGTNVSQKQRALFDDINPPRPVTFSWWGGLRTSITGIAMLAGDFILLLGPPKPDRLKDRGQTK